MSEDHSGNKSAVQQRTLLSVGPLFPRFSKQDVSAECLAWVIDVAREAAAECNLQPWRWIVVRSEPAKKRLESASFIDVPLSSAPVILICLADTQAWKSAPEHFQEMVASEKITEEQGRELLRRVQEYYSSSPEIAQRTALANGVVAVHQLLLGAASCGLSAYWVTDFDANQIKSYFHIPDHFVVAALLPVGYQDQPAALADCKLPPRSFIYQEKFGEPLSQTS